MNKTVTFLAKKHPEIIWESMQTRTKELTESYLIPKTLSDAYKDRKHDIRMAMYKGTAFADWLIAKGFDQNENKVFIRFPDLMPDEYKYFIFSDNHGSDTSESHLMWELYKWLIDNYDGLNAAGTRSSPFPLDYNQTDTEEIIKEISWRVIE